MTIANYFYNGLTKKYIALFGTIFNKMKIERNDPATGEKIQEMIVPISYGPYQKFLARITQDPNLDRKTLITLPRMSFEIVSMQYDAPRKIPSLKKIRSNTTESDFVYAPSPYNIEFSLSIMTAYAEDGTQIIEQILPFFKPDYVQSVYLIDGIDPIDVAIILNSVQSEDIYDGEFETRRSLLWNLNFTMYAQYFGPIREKSIIKFVDVKLFTDMVNPELLPQEEVLVYPGLTDYGTPSTNPEDTIPYQSINFDDDWGVIKIINTEL